MQKMARNLRKSLTVSARHYNVLLNSKLPVLELVAPRFTAHKMFIEDRDKNLSIKYIAESGSLGHILYVH
jgi:hypothetical protein